MGFQVKLLTIDPGVHNMALAEWGLCGELEKAYNIRCGSELCLGAQLTHWSRVGREISRMGRFHEFKVVGEMPVAYPGKQGMKVDANDLLHLAACAGAFYSGVAGCRTEIELVLPAEWKAQVPKDICRTRILGALSSLEAEDIERGGDMHNVYDAIGIGLFKLGRLGRGMVKVK